MWICSLGSVLCYRLVETGNGDLPSCSRPWRIGFVVDIAMLCVAVHGLKLFTTLHCKNYFNVIITARTKDNARIKSFEMSGFKTFTKSKQNMNVCSLDPWSPVILMSRKIFSRMYQWLIFLDTFYFIHYDANLPLVFQTRSCQAFFWLSIGIGISIVLVLRHEVNQDFPCLQNWLSHKLPNDQTIPIHVYIGFLWQ